MAIEEEIEVWDLTHMRILLSMLNRELTDNITFNNHLLSYTQTTFFMYGLFSLVILFMFHQWVAGHIYTFPVT